MWWLVATWSDQLLAGQLLVDLDHRRVVEVAVALRDQRVEVLGGQRRDRRGGGEAASHLQDDVQVLVVEADEEARRKVVLHHSLAVDVQHPALRVAAEERLAD